MKRRMFCLVAAAALLTCSGLQAQPPFPYEARKPMNTSLPAKLAPLFARTKDICFGRYVLTVPEEAQEIWGDPNSISGGFKTHPGQAAQAKELLMRMLDEEKKKSMEGVNSDRAPHQFQLLGMQEGPGKGSWYAWFYTSEFDEKIGLKYMAGVKASGAHAFSYRKMSGRKETMQQMLESMLYLASRVRARDNSEVPADAGVCMDSGFVADNTHRFQEMSSIGIYLPSLPDVSFSAYSNKSASTQGENGAGLLQQVREAREEDGVRYAYSSLREGKRKVSSWDGEESLGRHKGSHALHFEWAYVGVSGNPAKPAHLDARLDTRVEHNVPGAADHSSVTDQEAIALWDKLLDSLRFREPVPDAVIDPTGKTPPPLPIGAPACPSGQVCPQTGWWRPTVPPGHPEEKLLRDFGKDTPMLAGNTMPRFGLHGDLEKDIRWIWVRPYSG